MDSVDAAAASSTPVHPHEYDGEVPDRLPAATIRELSRLEPGRAALAIAEEWLAIVAAIAFADHLGAGWLYPFFVIFIGARQHALAVLGHDAVHYRLFPGRRLNDWAANLLLWWPIGATNETFRRYHGDHHRYLGTDRDGNITLWRLRGRDGRQTREWTYPKRPWQLAAKLLWRGSGLTGAAMLAVGLVRPFFLTGVAYGLARLAFVGGAVAIFDAVGRLDLLLAYWLVPLVTWFVCSNYIRLICEHSAVRSDRPLYALTRTTIPSWLDLLLIVPRNISYHYEHHIYPSVPFYNLPALHAAMQGLPGFRAHARVCRGVRRALAECVERPGDPG